jgi:hypothetical protein
MERRPKKGKRWGQVLEESGDQIGSRRRDKYSVKCMTPKLQGASIARALERGIPEMYKLWGLYQTLLFPWTEKEQRWGLMRT